MPGMQIPRRFTVENQDPFAAVQWEIRDVVMTDAKGVEIFRQDACEVPAWWNDIQTQVCVSKYFAGGIGTPERETSFKQVFARVVRTIASWGIAGGYFRDEASLCAFHDDLIYMLCTGRYAFNSPVFFNLGDPTSRPQASACFINSVDDTMESILSLGVREGMQFKYGSGSGTDLSRIRSKREIMRGGGHPSGPMSFARGWDKMSGAIRSGGKKRRAAKMLSMKVDHPDIRDFILHKVQEEKKARALIDAGYDGSIDGEAYATVDGQNANNSVRLTDKFMCAATGEVYQGTTVPDAWPLTARTTGEVIETDSANALLDLICTTACASGDPGVQFHDEMNRWNKCPSLGEQCATNPCSEFSHIDDTSCNLGSHNLRAYQRPDGTLDVADFRHGVMLSCIAQEIICGDATGVMFQPCTCDRDAQKGHESDCPKLKPRPYGAWYPTLTIRQRTQETRPLGIGYCGAGAFVMYAGLAYDSDEARLLIAGITALMTGQAYATSAEIAQHCGGPFPAYHANAAHMQRIMHAYGENAAPLWMRVFESVETFDGRKEIAGEMYAPYFATHQARLHLGAEMGDAIRDVWHTAISKGDRYGYRNDETTAIAPTGTISFLMGMQHSTSGECLMSLISYKRLVGGGYLTITTPEMRPALERLGYSAEQVQEICAYCTAEVEGRARGHLEGAPHLRAEHLPIFDTAFHSLTGTRTISPQGHYLMLAAIQVHCSMAVSKTVNLPQHATPEDFRRTIVEAWRRGAKSVSIYRDMSKGSQPVSASVRSDAENARGAALGDALVKMLSAHCGETGLNESAEETLQRILTGHALLMQAQAQAGAESAAHLLQRMMTGAVPVKRSLGPTCAEIRHRFDVAGQTVYFKVGIYPDGKPGELWINVSKDGSTLSGVFGCFSRAISYALQYGVPMETLVEDFRHMSFEPRGFTDLGYVSSIVDYVFKWIAEVFPAAAPRILLQTAQAMMGIAQPAPQPATPERIDVIADVRRAEDEQARAFREQSRANGPACKRCGNMMSLNAGGKCYQCNHCGDQDGGCGGN